MECRVQPHVLKQNLFVLNHSVYTITSPTMPRHIRGLYVTSARKFKLNNEPSRPNTKKKWPTSANTMYVLRDYGLTSQVLQKSAYGFWRWHISRRYETFSAEILPLLEISGATCDWVWIPDQVCILAISLVALTTARIEDIYTFILIFILIYEIHVLISSSRGLSSHRITTSFQWAW